MSYMLAIESSSSICSVALGAEQIGDMDITVKVESGKRTHTQFMLPFVDELLQSANIHVSELKAIAFSAGPGSFTGIRLATSVAKSLAYAVNIPVIPVSSLAAIAQAFYSKAGHTENCLVITDARMGEVYFAEYGFVDGVVTSVKPDTLLGVEQFSSFSHDSQKVVGDAWHLLEDIEWMQGIERYNLQAGAEDILLLAREMMYRGEVEQALNAEAIYLRDKTSWKTTEQQSK